MKSKEELLQKVRTRLKKDKGSRRDPSMFRVPNVKAGDDPLKFRFVVLPGLSKGDKCADGVASATMGGVDHDVAPKEKRLLLPFCVKGGQHWINNLPYGCPRLFDGEDCPWCNVGFNLRNECDIEEERKKIARMYLPRSIFAANIFFPADKVNPPEYHDQVMWYIMPKTVYDKMEECLMRENAGDEVDPKPFGFFYDPEDCLVFQLEVGHKGGFNNYVNSKFLLNRVSLPEDKVDDILGRRHDLVAKFPERNSAELQGLLDKVMSGAPSTPSRPAQQETPKPTASKPAPEKEEPKEDLGGLSPSRKTAPAQPEEATKSNVAEIDDPELQGLIDLVQGED